MFLVLFYFMFHLSHDFIFHVSNDVMFHVFPGKERVTKDDKVDFTSKKEEEKWKRRSLPAGKVQGKEGHSFTLVFIVTEKGIDDSTHFCLGFRLQNLFAKHCLDELG